MAQAHDMESDDEFTKVYDQLLQEEYCYALRCEWIGKEIW